MAGYNGRMVGKLRRMVWDCYPHVCHWCKRPLTFDAFTVEHLLARSKDGTHELPNLRPACAGKNKGGCGENFARGDGTRSPAKKLIDNRDFFKK